MNQAVDTQTKKNQKARVLSFARQAKMVTFG